MSLRVTAGVTAGLLLAGVLGLAACDGPGPLSKKAKDAKPDVASLPPPPRPPGWAPALLGAELPTTFPNTMPCLGNVDHLGPRYQESVTVVGWGWNTETKAPVAHVVAVNRRGRFVGFGEGGQPRPDVPTSRTEVTSGATGWTLVTGAPAKNGVRVYGVDLEAKAACLLGEFAPIPG